jgi:hypothetical protein
MSTSMPLVMVSSYPSFLTFSMFESLKNWIRSEPTGIFARCAWYLYDLLTGRTLDVTARLPATYSLQ